MYENLDIITIGEGLVELSSSTSLKFAQIFDKYYGGGRRFSLQCYSSTQMR